MAKEVLQHLTDEEVHKVMDDAVTKYKYIVVQNGCDSNSRNGGAQISDQSGQCRKTNLQEPPFDYTVLFTKSKGEGNGIQTFQIITNPID